MRTEPTSRKTARRVVALSSCVLFVAVGGFAGWSRAYGGGPIDGEPVAAPETVLVRTMTVSPRQDVAEARAVGEIRPQRESDHGFRLSGKLVERAVDVGAAVRKGDVIARIDDQDYRNRLRSAEADRAAAEAGLVEAKASEARMRTLLEKGFTTRANQEAALKNLRSAAAKLEAMDAALDLAADQLAYTQLHAEFDGVITGVGVEEGQVVNVGQTIASIADPALKDAVFAVSEVAFGADAANPEEPVMVSLLSDPATVVPGTVREIAPIADPATRTYEVRVGLHNPPAAMRFGASVAGRVKTDAGPVVVLPGGALFDSGGDPAVWIVGRNQTVSLRPVSVERYETDRIVVDGGLAEGDVVVVAGVNRLRDSQTVRIEGASR